MEGFPKQPQALETSPLSDRDKVLQALESSLSGVALERFMAMKPAGTPGESFARWVDDFNAATPEERGKGIRDTGRPLTEHHDITETLQTASGHSLIVTLHKSGEVTLSTPTV
jgi:hypothetical protein